MCKKFYRTFGKISSCEANTIFFNVGRGDFIASPKVNENLARANIKHFYKKEHQSNG